MKLICNVNNNKVHILVKLGGKKRQKNDKK